MLKIHARWFYFSIACVSLCVGYALYFVGRPGSAIFAIPDNLEHWVYALPLLSEISGPLPSFFHTFAFILFLALVLNPSRAGKILICLGWMTVELFFEIGQHSFFANHLVEWIPLWFAGIPFLEVADFYFLSGTFDPVDVLFILFGAAAALFTLSKFQRWEVGHGFNE